MTHVNWDDLDDSLKQLLLAMAVDPAGWLPKDDLTQEWLQAVQQFRDECDETDRRRLAEGAGGDESAS